MFILLFCRLHSLPHFFLSHLSFLCFLRSFLLHYIQQRLVLIEYYSIFCAKHLCNHLFCHLTIHIFLYAGLLCIQIDSLKYLRACSSKYGAERIAKYVRAIWSSLKDTISTYLEEPDFSFTLAPVDGIGFPKNELVTEALSLLHQLILQNSSLLVSLIIDDEDVNIFIETIASYEKYNDIPVKEKKKLHCVGRILYITAKTSFSSCNAVFQSLFSQMMDNLVSVRNIDNPPNVFPHERVKFGLLYLCIELLEGCRELITVSEEPALQYVFEHQTCCTKLHRFSTPLFDAFCSILVVSGETCPFDPEMYIGGECFFAIWE